MAEQSEAGCPERRKVTATESVRFGLSAGALRQAVLDNLTCLLARFPAVATSHDWYAALAYTVRDRLLGRWVATTRTYQEHDVKVACYLSAEYLIGPQLGKPHRASTSSPPRARRWRRSA